jgi:hypothetical protein
VSVGLTRLIRSLALMTLIKNLGRHSFSRWLRDYVETCSNAVITDEIRNVAVGPLFIVTKYQAMDTNGTG